MKPLRYIVWMIVLAFAACSSIPEVDQPIHECAAPTEGRAVAMCFNVGDIIYIVSGRRQNEEYAPTMLRYNTANDQWDQSGNIPITPRVNGTACATQHGVFLGLGYAGGSVNDKDNYLHDWWCYDPQNEQWTRLADIPVSEAVSSVSWTDNQYVWVGFGFHGFSNAVWRYDIQANTWTEQAQSGSLPDRATSPVAAQCNGRYFAGTGFRRYSRSGWWEWFNDGHWEGRAAVPGSGRHNAVSAGTDKHVWVMGGWHYGDSLTTGFHYDDILRYTPDSNRWVLCGTLPCGTMENGAACAIGNRLYFGLGEDKYGHLHKHWYLIED